MDRVRKMIGCDLPECSSYTGKGVYIAVLDSGVANHPDLEGRIAAFKDFTRDGKEKRIKNIKEEYYDDNGHGTHVCGILAGNGKSSKGKYKGIAPESILVCGKVLDKNGGGSMSALIEGVEWVIELKKTLPIRIVNISIEMDVEEKLKKDELLLLKEYFDRFWAENTIVISAAGNKGPGPMTLSPISECGSCICVGCHDGDYSGKGRRNCKAYSGRGPGKISSLILNAANPLKKPDIVAPGTDIVSCNYKYNRQPYISKSGTSMAAPIVSGACALCMHKYPSISNRDLKRILLHTAKDLGDGWSIQGAGMVQIKGVLTSVNY